MDISASDVENVTFATAKKGYEPDQVDRFLDNVAATLRGLEDQLRQARARIGELENQSQEATETEEMMRRTLLVAQRASDEAVAEAQAHAREMIATAEAQARDLESQATARANELEGRMHRQRQAFEADIEALKRFHADFRQALQQMISEHADVLHKTGRLAEQLPDLPGGAEAPVKPAQRPASLAPEPRAAEPAPPPAPRPATPDAIPATGPVTADDSGVTAPPEEPRMMPPRPAGADAQRTAPPPPTPGRHAAPEGEERSAPPPPVPAPGVAPASRPATAPD
ncbi:MAG: hypothetical protein DCC49_02480 [Acidobacteria bacterium]|nr:MAG: hypothetical protein DCC49_02480 [Acidobacteriota bacterium]